MAIRILDNRSPEAKAKGQRKKAANQAVENYETVVADLTTNWAGLNAPAKTEALRQGLVLALRMIRAVWN